MKLCKHCNEPVVGRSTQAKFCSLLCKNRSGNANAISKTHLEVRKAAVRYKYGIGWEELEELHRAAGERCEICTTPIKLLGDHKRESVHVDHSHTTGKVRGVLCLKCNVGLGAFLDSRLHLLRAIEYLDKHADSGSD